MITFEGGDGIKHPELFKHIPIFNANKVPTVGNVTITDGITNQLDRQNYISTNVLSTDLYNKNIEFRIKFFFTRITAYQMIIAPYGKASGIGFGGNNQGFFGSDGYVYPTLKPSYTLIPNKTYIAIALYQNNLLDFKLYDENMEFLTSFTSSIPFSNNSADWRLGLGQEYGKYPAYICYDLKETWIKDLDTNEILVPWFE